MDKIKKSSMSSSNRLSTSSSQRVLTKTCKMYLTKYQQIKREIDTKAKEIQQMKVKKSNLEAKTRRNSINDKCNNYKLEMVSNKQNIEEYLNIYKQQYGGELSLLEQKDELEIKLRNFLVTEQELRTRLEELKRQIKQSKQNSKYNIQTTKHEQLIKQIRFKLIQKQIEINNFCSMKRLRNLRYYVCQFGKQNKLSVISDIDICESGKVSILQDYLKSQPIFVNIKRQVQQYISLYKQLDQSLNKRPNVPELLESMRLQQQQIINKLQSISISITSVKTQLQRNSKQIQQQTNKQLKLNLKTLLQQNIDNPANLRNQAKNLALQQKRRVSDVKCKLNEMRRIQDCLVNIKSVENSKKQLLNRKNSLDKVIDEQENQLRNKLLTKEELENCLDNIISDGYAFNQELRKSKRGTVINMDDLIEKPEQNFRMGQVLNKNTSRKEFSKMTQNKNSSTAVTSYTSRQSRLVSMSETQRRLPITHSMNKKSVQDIIMSRITRKSNI